MAFLAFNVKFEQYFPRKMQCDVIIEAIITHRDDDTSGGGDRVHTHSNRPRRLSWFFKKIVFLSIHFISIIYRSIWFKLQKKQQQQIDAGKPSATAYSSGEVIINASIENSDLMLHPIDS